MPDVTKTWPQLSAWIQVQDAPKIYFLHNKNSLLPIGLAPYGEYLGTIKIVSANGVHYETKRINSENVSYYRVKNPLSCRAIPTMLRS
jgi:hypothetical protein